MGWNNIVIEGFCIGGKCGKQYPTAYCLDNGHCPYFWYSESSEREAAFFVPLQLILRDKFHSFCESVFSRLHWCLWDKWHFDDSFLRSIPLIKRGEYPEMGDDLDKIYNRDTEYAIWLDGVKHEV